MSSAGRAVASVIPGDVDSAVGSDGDPRVELVLPAALPEVVIEGLPLVAGLSAVAGGPEEEL